MVTTPVHRDLQQTRNVGHEHEMWPTDAELTPEKDVISIGRELEIPGSERIDDYVPAVVSCVTVAMNWFLNLAGTR